MRDPLPPRTRGRQHGDEPGHVGAPSTPAHAGPTVPCNCQLNSRRLYPRARGADAAVACASQVSLPLPPRTRGRLGSELGDLRGEASTPAHAGPTPVNSTRAPPTSLYPRARGADTGAAPKGRQIGPLPPRTRGRRPPDLPCHADVPSTPAHAGPTVTEGGSGDAHHLYPRARGADSGRPLREQDTWPLPPRTRGRLEAPLGVQISVASTPAHAGPTSTSLRYLSMLGIYPRARGADVLARQAARGVQPLPPRTRGRQVSAADARPGDTSTPAHAGPTAGPGPGAATPSLYPRARGADLPRRCSGAKADPLPPRTRGRREGVADVLVGDSSTPAHAGPTRRACAPARAACLYPRARGADTYLEERGTAMLPLPPRTRGRHLP